jgi:hypothetical protein
MNACRKIAMNHIKLARIIIVFINNFTNKSSASPSARSLYYNRSSWLLPLNQSYVLPTRREMASINKYAWDYAPKLYNVALAKRSYIPLVGDIKDSGAAGVGGDQVQNFCGKTFLDETVRNPVQQVPVDQPLQVTRMQVPYNRDILYSRVENHGT